MPAIAHPTHDQLAKRYKILAGPYAANETALLDKCVASLSGCRIHVDHHSDPRGTMIWRIRTEYETEEETAARLHRKPDPSDLSEES
jgi:hypothetical protein